MLLFFFVLAALPSVVSARTCSFVVCNSAFVSDVPISTPCNQVCACTCALSNFCNGTAVPANTCVNTSLVLATSSPGDCAAACSQIPCANSSSNCVDRWGARKGVRGSENPVCSYTHDSSCGGAQVNNVFSSPCSDNCECDCFWTSCGCSNIGGCSVVRGLRVNTCNNLCKVLCTSSVSGCGGGAFKRQCGPGQDPPDSSTTGGATAGVPGGGSSALVLIFDVPADVTTTSQQISSTATSTTAERTSTSTASTVPTTTTSTTFATTAAPPTTTATFTQSTRITTVASTVSTTETSVAPSTATTTTETSTTSSSTTAISTPLIQTSATSSAAPITTVASTVSTTGTSVAPSTSTTTSATTTVASTTPATTTATSSQSTTAPPITTVVSTVSTTATSATPSTSATTSAAMSTALASTTATSTPFQTSATSSAAPITTVASSILTTETSVAPSTSATTTATSSVPALTTATSSAAPITTETLPTQLSATETAAASTSIPVSVSLTTVTSGTSTAAATTAPMMPVCSCLGNSACGNHYLQLISSELSLDNEFARLIGYEWSNYSLCFPATNRSNLLIPTSSCHQSVILTLEGLLTDRLANLDVILAKLSEAKACCVTSDCRTMADFFSSRVSPQVDNVLQICWNASCDQRRSAAEWLLWRPITNCSSVSDCYFVGLSVHAQWFKVQLTIMRERDVYSSISALAKCTVDDCRSRLKADVRVGFANLLYCRIAVLLGFDFDPNARNVSTMVVESVTSRASACEGQSCDLQSFSNFDSDRRALHVALLFYDSHLRRVLGNCSSTSCRSLWESQLQLSSLQRSSSIEEGPLSWTHRLLAQTSYKVPSEVSITGIVIYSLVLLVSVAILAVLIVQRLFEQDFFYGLVLLGVLICAVLRIMFWTAGLIGLSDEGGLYSDVVFFILDQLANFAFLFAVFILVFLWARAVHLELRPNNKHYMIATISLLVSLGVVVIVCITMAAIVGLSRNYVSNLYGEGGANVADLVMSAYLLCLGAMLVCYAVFVHKLIKDETSKRGEQHQRALKLILAVIAIFETLFLVRMVLVYVSVLDSSFHMGRAIYYGITVLFCESVSCCIMLVLVSLSFFKGRISQFVSQKRAISLKDAKANQGFQRGDDEINIPTTYQV